MRSVELYLDTAGKSVVAYQLKFPDKKIDGSCEVQTNGNLKCEGIDQIKVEVKGQTGKSGTIVFQEGKIIKVIKLVIGDYEYSMDESGKITEKEPGGLEETDVSCFDYNEKEDRTGAITKYKCGGYYDQGDYIGQGIYALGDYHEGEIMDVVISSKIDGKTVSSIDDTAFGANSFTYFNGERNLVINSIVIPDSVTYIGAGAFEYNQLTNLEIPDSVTEIERFAFRNNQLANVKIGNSVISIGNCSFDYNQLTNLEIPDSVTTIGVSAFQGNRIENLIIETGITDIYQQAFDENPLKTVKIKAPKSNLSEVLLKSNKSFRSFDVSNIEWING